jgi:hypothetical protein
MMRLLCTRSFYETVCGDPIFTPIGLAVGASAATAASTGAAVVGTVATVASAGAAAASALNTANAQSKAAQYNATVSNNNAIGAELAGAAEADRANLAHRRALASGVAAAGASGIDPNSGSPLEVLADMSGQAKLDEELGRWQARQRSQGYASQANLDTFQARSAKSAGYANAASSVLSSVGSAYGGRRR